MSNNSEKRDAALVRRREAKEKHDALVELGGERYLKYLGLDRPAASLNAPAPSRSAWRHALTLRKRAAQSLRATFAQGNCYPPLESEKTPRVPYQAPPDLDPSTPPGGLVPLTVACYPELAVRVLHQVTAHELAAFEGVKEYLAAQISHALYVEYDLWKHAGEERIPYPFVYQSLQHLRKGKAQPPHESLCLRCGDLLTNTRRHTAAVRCPHCAKEPNEAREWPAHAILPHTQGKWWLRCQTASCTTPFQGSRQAHWCEAHRSARVTPSRRAARRPGPATQIG